MIDLLTDLEYAVIAFVGILFAFGATCIAIHKLNRYLPKDMGREYAYDGALSAGKPRGAGIIFVFVFVASTLLFAKMTVETALYLILIVVEMFTGFCDDAAKKPWGEYLKGFLDLSVALVTSLVYLHYNGSGIFLAAAGVSVTLHPALFLALSVILVWASINVTNCSDGVDGLSGTLSIISLVTFYVLDHLLGVETDFNFCILLFVVCLLGYLWYNATPSKLMMGDAGSRAMGIFLAITALKSRSPLMFLAAAAMLIIDGGLGLIKVSLLRFLKIRILKNVTTPIHDHMKKRLGWSNAQVVFRFAIIQIVVSVAFVYLILI